MKEENLIILFLFICAVALWSFIIITYNDEPFVPEGYVAPENRGQCLAYETHWGLLGGSSHCEQWEDLSKSK